MSTTLARDGLRRQPLEPDKRLRTAPGEVNKAKPSAVGIQRANQDPTFGKMRGARTVAIAYFADIALCDRGRAAVFFRSTQKHPQLLWPFP